jgi:putative flippase GtrA
MLSHNRVLRFGVVGFANAAISFGILNLCFYIFHQSKIVSSVIATSCALLFSFALNRSFVFADKSRRIHHQFIPFAIVTISGSLIVINLVYIGMLHVLDGHETEFLKLLKDVTGVQFSKSFIDINLSTVIGAIAAMIWNYNGYRLFVFKGSQASSGQQYEAAVATEKAD